MARTFDFNTLTTGVLGSLKNVAPIISATKGNAVPAEVTVVTGNTTSAPSVSAANSVWKNPLFIVVTVLFILLILGGVFYAILKK